MLRSVIRTFILDYCLDVFFNKVTINLRVNPFINKEQQEELEVTHFLSKHFDSYIEYIHYEENGFLTFETFCNFLDKTGLRPPTDDIKFLYECFEMMAEMELEPIGYLNEDGDFIEEIGDEEFLESEED